MELFAESDLRAKLICAQHDVAWLKAKHHRKSRELLQLLADANEALALEVPRISVARERIAAAIKKLSEE